MVQHPSPLAPLLFPLPNLLATAKLTPSSSKPAPQPILPTLGVADYVALVATSVRASALAYMVVFLVSPSYPGLLGGRALGPLASWAPALLARNLAATWAVCGLWDWILYLSPLRDRLA